MQQDPDFLDIVALTEDKERATEWTRDHNLTANPVGNPCTFTPGCTGVLSSSYVRICNELFDGLYGFVVNPNLL